MGYDPNYLAPPAIEGDVLHERKNYLTAQQAGTIARTVGAKAVIPFHFSPRYEGCERELIEEAQRAWELGPRLRGDDEAAERRHAPG